MNTLKLQPYYKPFCEVNLCNIKYYHATYDASVLFCSEVQLGKSPQLIQSCQKIERISESAFWHPKKGYLIIFMQICWCHKVKIACAPLLISFFSGVYLCFVKEKKINLVSGLKIKSTLRLMRHWQFNNFSVGFAYQEITHARVGCNSSLDYSFVVHISFQSEKNSCCFGHIFIGLQLAGDVQDMLIKL